MKTKTIIYFIAVSFLLKAIKKFKKNACLVSHVEMSAKIVVHKIEKGNHFQSLDICIEENDNETKQAKFSNWIDGKLEPKKKDIEKSRLLVKVANEIDCNNLNLDCCADEVKADNNFNNNYNELYKGNIKRKSFLENENSIDVTFEKQYHVKLDDVKPLLLEMFNQDKQEPTRQFSKSPLEYSLEKVQENNARIMENIHMLNKTLNYTKDKEISDIINVKPLRSYPCSECDKCFVYETGLRRHFFTRHGNIDSFPRWQTVWTCPECFQVWPNQDAAKKHLSQCCMNNNIDAVKEIKTSLLLQCEFCEKVYTCIPRLLRHFKYHTTKYNYECNGCNVAFTSYKSAEQHWQQCPWLKLNYSFSLPKMLLCNACDRKFRNYEQLYNHRYKVGHYMGKNPDKCSNWLSLVYQCEICSQCFKETSQLESHRNQHTQNVTL